MKKILRIQYSAKFVFQDPFGQVKVGQVYIESVFHYQGDKYVSENASIW
jgi:hypothetical protein